MVKAISKEKYMKRFGFVYEHGEVSAFLDNGLLLWNMDWNGENFTNSTDADGHTTEREFRPITNLDEYGDGVIIGYEEV